MRIIVLGTAAMAGCFVSSALANPPTPMPGNLIQGVPDWNQPTEYSISGYNNWCSPTAGADIMGYWEDVKGVTGLADRQVFGASVAYPATAGTWEKGLYHDGTIELGWFMDTGKWQTGPLPFPPNNVPGTALVNIASGLQSYATTAWTDNNYPPASPQPGTGIVKTAFPTATVSTQYKSDINFGSLTWQQMWNTYTAEIDAGRPVELSFKYWVNTGQRGPDLLINGFTPTIEAYQWDTTSLVIHSVAGVGYIDSSPGNINGNQYFVVQDDWSTTGRYVAVPLDTTVWLQNDYFAVSVTPEPGTLALAAVALFCLAAWRSSARKSVTTISQH